MLSPRCIVLWLAYLLCLLEGRVVHGEPKRFAPGLRSSSSPLHYHNVTSTVSPTNGATPISTNPTSTNPDCRPVNQLNHGTISFVSVNGSTAVGAILTFSCDEGYKMIGGNRSTCQEDGNWTIPHPECKKLCRPLDVVNVIVSPNKDITAGTHVTISCIKGYALIGMTRNVCMSDGSWRVAWPFCRSDCGHLNQLDHGDINYVNGSTITSQGAIVTFSCYSGYQLVGDSQSICQADGQWSGHFPKCIKDCGPLQQLNHGKITYVNGSTVTYVGADATFTCNEGYQRVGDNQSTCQVDGKWTSQIPECRRDCGPIQHLNNGKITYVNGSTVTFVGAIVTFSCDLEYQRVGDYQSTCQADGKWSSQVPECLRDCRNVTLANGTLRYSSGTTYGSTVTYTCSDGYSLQGPHTSHCDATGRWSNNSTVCVIKDCRNVTLANGTLRYSSGTTYGSTVTYTCSDGYSLQGPNTAHCDTTGRWSNNSTVCVIKVTQTTTVPSTTKPTTPTQTTKIPSTTKLTTLKQTTAVSSTTKPTTTTQTTTVPSTTKPTTPTQTTTVSSTTNPTTLTQTTTVPSTTKPTTPTQTTTASSTTKPTTRTQTTTVPSSTNPTTLSQTPAVPTIIKPTTPTQTTVLPSQTKPTTPTLNTTVTSTTNPPTWTSAQTSAVSSISYNKTRIPTITSTAQPTANLVTPTPNTGVPSTAAATTSSMKPTEIAKRGCGKNVTIDNGQVVFPNINTYGSMLTYTCNSGYTLEGSNTSFCFQTGKWNNTGAICRIKDCGNVTLANGEVSYSNGTIFGSMLTYTCHQGYSLQGSARSYCDSTGTWNGNSTTCKILDCGNVTLPNGDVSYSNGTIFGSTLTYKCHAGYSLQGSPTSHCDSTGTWKDNSTTCDIRDCGNVTVPNGEVSYSNGTIFGSTLTYTCHAGYSLQGSPTTYCDSTGTWKDNRKACDIRDCGNVTIPNGEVSYSNGTIFGSTLTYTCHAGYSLHGSTTSYCDSTGTWNDTSTTCDIKDCGRNLTLNNGAVNYPDETTYGSMLIFTCNDGYTLVGPNFSYCATTGTWNDTSTSCKIKDCGDQVTIANGNVSYTNTTTFGSMLTYTCDPGYTLEGSRISYCDTTGTWNNTETVCKIKVCPPLDDVSKATYVLVNKSTNYMSQAVYSCVNGYETQDNRTLTCNASGLWDYLPPNCTDTDECQRNHGCHISAQCSNFDGGYNCECKNGFTDADKDVPGVSGRHCIDTDECKERIDNCNKNNTAYCFNIYGGYTCLCKKGWEGDSCTVDINECHKNGTCAKGATCFNLEGGYTCTCPKDRPQGDPYFKCYEKTIVDLTTPVEQKRYDRGQENPESFPDKFPYFGEQYEFYRVNMNGFIALGYKPIDQQHGPTTPELWKHFSMDYPIVAPLWANLDTTNITGAGLSVHHLSKTSTDNHTLTDLAIVKEVFNLYKGYEGFDPTFALVVTWRNATTPAGFIPYIAVQYHNATMQAILATDGLFSYVMFNYDQEQWTLDPKDAGNVSAGYSDANLKGHILANNDNFTHLVNNSNVVTGLNGRYIYNLTTVTDLLVNQSLCRKFAANETARQLLRENMMKATPCPCQEVIMKLDYTFREVGFLQNDSLYDHKFSAYCYEEWFFNYQGMKQRCCYGHGALKTNSVDGGFVSFENGAVDTINEYFRCCLGDHRLCPLFYDVSPSDDCKRWSPDDEDVEKWGLGVN